MYPPPPPTPQQRPANLKPSMTSRCLALFSPPAFGATPASKRNLNHPLPLPVRSVRAQSKKGVAAVATPGRFTSEDYPYGNLAPQWHGVVAAEQRTNPKKRQVRPRR